jgi:putative FmdB family regulatory protein
MPFYDYKCPKCCDLLEIEKSMTDASRPVCPKCKIEMQRIFYAPSIGRADKGFLSEAGTEKRGSCSTCKSGVCSGCKCK